MQWMRVWQCSFHQHICFAISMESDKIVICVNFAKAKRRNRTLQARKNMETMSTTFVFVKSVHLNTNKKRTQFSNPTFAPIHIWNALDLPLFQLRSVLENFSMRKIHQISCFTHYSTKRKKVSFSVFFMLQLKKNTYATRATLIHHTLAPTKLYWFYPGKSHKITMKTFPIFIRESNNHMNDLRLSSHAAVFFCCCCFTCIILFDSARPSSLYNICSGMMNERIAKKKDGINGSVDVNACAHIGNKFAIWCALIMRS